MNDPRTALPRVSRVEALPTLEDVLRLPEVVRGRPQVVAGHDLLDRTVRWAHVSDLTDIAALLRGSELVLTTGMSLPDGPRELRAYVSSLCDAGAAGLVLELGRRHRDVPPVLAQACALRSLPLIALRAEVPFVQVTEAIAALIMGGQDALLVAADRAHEVFTTLCVRGASRQEIVSALAAMAQQPVVFEDPLHRIVAWDSGGSELDDLLVGWEHRSRQAITRRPTDIPDGEKWLVASVEARNEVLGRLVLLSPNTPSATERMLLERASVALTLVSLLDHEIENHARQLHLELLSDLVQGRLASVSNVQRRLDAIGINCRGKTFSGVMIRDCSRGDEQAVAGGPTSDSIAILCRDMRIEAVVGPSIDRSIQLLLIGRSEVELRRDLTRLSELIHGRWIVVIALGSVVDDLRQVSRSFHEADQIAASWDRPGDRPFYELRDINLRGLMHALAGDPRIQAFVERSLGPVLEVDARTGQDYLKTLRHYLESSNNRTRAAANAKMSRQSFYQRLARIESLLSVDLQDSATCASLLLAVTALLCSGGPVAIATNACGEFAAS